MIMRYTHSKKKIYKLSFSVLLTATAKKSTPTFGHCKHLNLLSATANLITISKIFTMTDPGKDKFKCATYPRYTVIIRIFKSRSNVIQMLL